MQNRSHQIIIAFTLAQVAALLVFGYTPYPDSNGYIGLAAESIAHGQPYPVSTLLNTYPFLWNVGAINAVALSLSLFHSVTPLLVVYCLMKGATAWLLWCLCRHLFSERTAFIVLLLYVVYPANYGEGTSTLSELPFMFFAMLGLWLSLVRGHHVAAGMVMAVANWFRPFGIVFLTALAVCLLAAERHRIKAFFASHSIKAFFTGHSLKTLCTAKALRPVVGYLLAILVIGGISHHRTGLFLYQAKTGWMALSDYSSDHAPASMAVRDHTEWNVSEKDRAWRRLFFLWLKDHPGQYVAQMPRKLVDTYVSDNVNLCAFLPDKQQRTYLYDELSMKTLARCFPRFTPVQWLAVVNLAVYYLLLLGAAAAVCLSVGRPLRNERRAMLLPLTVIALGTLMLLLVGHGEARFHIPFMPFVIMLAGITVSHKVNRP